MDDRFRHIAALASAQHSVVSTAQLHANGIDASTRSKWERKGLIDRTGPRSFALAGSSPTFQRAMAVGLADLAGFGVAAGRAGARLYGLDDFASAGAEFLLPRPHRRYTTNGLVCSTSRPLTRSDITRCSSAGDRTQPPPPQDSVQSPQSTPLLAPGGNGYDSMPFTPSVGLQSAPKICKATRLARESLNKSTDHAVAR